TSRLLPPVRLARRAAGRGGPGGALRRRRPRGVRGRLPAVHALPRRAGVARGTRVRAAPPRHGSGRRRLAGPVVHLGRAGERTAGRARRPRGGRPRPGHVHRVTGGVGPASSPTTPAPGTRVRESPPRGGAPPRPSPA